MSRNTFTEEDMNIVSGIDKIDACLHQYFG
jgi:hypothetical protein